MPAALVVSLSNPLPWVMSRPAVYEAAIAAAQFFFMAAIYMVILLSRKLSVAVHLLALPGAFMAMAIASRITILPGVILVLAGFILYLDRKRCYVLRSGRNRVWQKRAVVFAPVITGLIILAIYNQLRFGSFFDFGHRYQLTLENFAGYYTNSFSLRNVLPNLYNYLLNPFRKLDTFPFIKPLWGRYSVPILKSTASASYNAEQVTGMLVSIPFLSFIFLPLYYSFKTIWKQIDAKPIRDIRIRLVLPNSWSWLFITLLVASFVMLIPL